MQQHITYLYISRKSVVPSGLRFSIAPSSTNFYTHENTLQYEYIYIKPIVNPG